MTDKFIGIDDGHSSIKIFLGYDDNGKPIQHSVPAISKKIRGTGVSHHGLTDEQVEKMTVNVRGSHYIVDRVYAAGGDNILNDDYPTSDNNIANIVNALCKYKKDLDGSEVNLITGLPLSHYFDPLSNAVNKDNIEAKKQNICELENAYRISDKKSFISIAKQSVEPEGYAAFIDVAFDKELNATEYTKTFLELGCIVIDIGGRTIDTLIIQAESMRPLYSDMRSANKGMLYALNSLCKKIEGRTSRKHDSYSILQVIKDKKSGKTDVSAEVDVTLEALARDTFDEIKDVVSRPENEGGIILTGGGAELIGGKLQKIIADEVGNDIDVIVPDDPQFSNARGFWKSSIRKFK